MTMLCDDTGTSGLVSGQVRRMEVFTGAGGRRRWPAEIKAKIVAETLAAGMSVCEVARRHGLAPNQVFAWRRQLRRAAEAGVGAGMFVPVAIDPPVLAADRGRSAMGTGGVTIEVELEGATMRIANGAQAGLVGAIIAALQAVR